MSELAELIEETQPRFEQLAPAHIQYRAEAGFAVQLLKNNSYLRKAANQSPQSLQQAIVNIASIGLTLNPAEKLAYLIPRSVKVNDSQWELRIFLEPSYVGLMRLATDAGSIKWVQAKCVYANDMFYDNGAGEKPSHTYDPFSKDRGEFVGVYCVAKTSEGDYLTTIMPDDEVQSIKARNESVKKGKQSTWDSDFSEMAKKAVIRRAFKTWPRSDERRLSEAVHLSNENEGFEPILTSPALHYTADQKEYLDQLIENSDAMGMYLFEHSLCDGDPTSPGASIWTSLTHSFERGQKGKYQAVIKALGDKGRSIIHDYVQSIEQSIGDDNGAVLELIGELDTQSLDIIQSRLPDEMQTSFAQLVAGES